MQKKRGKPVSFDAMVKFFMRQYNIPTKQDVTNLMIKIDRLEALIRSIPAPGKSKRSDRKTGFNSPLTASDIVLGVIKKSGQGGVDFAEMQAETGFEEKKLRNIIFRLKHIEKIERKSRGVYIVS
ncbi:MAG: hypothetical protein LWW98_01720 [Deltaproteobacteria bacterium]|nr:hypothetical protein [Deltaproteobacteria bacterium]